MKIEYFYGALSCKLTSMTSKKLTKKSMKDWLIFRMTYSITYWKWIKFSFLASQRVTILATGYYHIKMMKMAKKFVTVSAQKPSSSLLEPGTFTTTPEIKLNTINRSHTYCQLWTILPMTLLFPSPWWIKYGTRLIWSVTLSAMKIQKTSVKILKRNLKGNSRNSLKKLARDSCHWCVISRISMFALHTTLVSLVKKWAFQLKCA